MFQFKIVLEKDNSIKVKIWTMADVEFIVILVLEILMGMHAHENYMLITMLQSCSLCQTLCFPVLKKVQQLSMMKIQATTCEKTNDGWASKQVYDQTHACWRLDTMIASVMCLSPMQLYIFSLLVHWQRCHLTWNLYQDKK